MAIHRTLFREKFQALKKRFNECVSYDMNYDDVFNGLVKKEIEYGTTFWKSNSPNFTNKHIENNNRGVGVHYNLGIPAKKFKKDQIYSFLIFYDEKEDRLLFEKSSKNR